MAWFKHVKNMRSQTDLNHFLCYLVCGEIPSPSSPPISLLTPLSPEKPLLTPSAAPTDDYLIRASTHTGSLGVSDAILQFSDTPHYWCPMADDPTPTLDVEFSRNRVVTALEVRGDPSGAGHIKEATLNYRKLLFHTVCEAPHVSQLSTRGSTCESTKHAWIVLTRVLDTIAPLQPQQLQKIAVTTQEKAWFVTFKPLEWDRDADFCIALRVLASTPSPIRSKPRSRKPLSRTSSTPLFSPSPPPQRVWPHSLPCIGIS